MLGEGFDLPQLKVAAIHSPHKSLGVTLQFIGRFARVAGSDIGTASVFVGPPEGDYDDRIRRLYSEDADWNELVRQLTDDAAEAEAELADFEAGFGTQRGEVSPRSLAPKMQLRRLQDTMRRLEPSRRTEALSGAHAPHSAAAGQRAGTGGGIRGGATAAGEVG